MHIICDQCLTKFQVKKHAIKSHGRVVRCGNCEYEWIARPGDLHTNFHFSIPRRFYLLLFILLFTLIFTSFAVFLRNDPRLRFLELYNHQYLSVKQLDTGFYRTEEGHSYVVVRAKVTNSSNAMETLNSILVVIESQGGQRVKMLDNINVSIMPERSIIIPLRIEGVDAQVVSIKAYVGGKNLMLIRRVFL